ncbi:MAG TPA: alpha-E domain-containing protein, partial [Dongiaceae bacterium]
DFDTMDASAMARFLEWVKEISLRIDGSGYRTMLRNDAYWFARLGIFLERADNTARILDVKYHVLLPENVEVGGGLDYSQWAAILRAVSALTAYHHVYHESLKPMRIADLMLLNPKMPRSVASCYGAICANLDSLAEAYGKQGEAQRQARSMRNRFENARIEQIFQSGLHEFCETVIAENARLGGAISEQYLV